MTYVASHAGIFELIFADSGSQPVPTLLCIGKYEVRCVFSTEFFQCDGASWRLHARVVLARRVAMDTSLLCLKGSGSRQTFKTLVPKLLIGDEFKLVKVVKKNDPWTII